MSDDESLTEQLLDLLVYAPIGLAYEAKELLPKLADRGRGQVALTRLAGKVASDRGTRQGRSVLDQLVGVVGSALSGDAAGRSGGSTSTRRVDRVPTPPIDDYDSFTAAQLLPKLTALSHDELDAVLAYEQAHRDRTTVTNRVKQLRR